MAAARGPHDSGASRPWPRALGAVGGMAGRFALVLALAAIDARAELPPEIGYVFPAGGRAGETIDVLLGGYDWTSDVELFPHDPGVALAITGAPSSVLIPEPPHLFGFKARANDRPCPREFPARLTLPADLPAGLHRFQVANASGASPPGFFHVSRFPAERERRTGDAVQELPALPLVIDGRIARNEEIDRYAFTAAADGPVWVDLVARRLLSPLHATIRVVDDRGETVVDVADTAGRDLTTCFDGRAGARYELSIDDIDHAGDRSAVYRLELSTGPRVLATFPAAGPRGTRTRVELVGVGLAAAERTVDRVEREIDFPGDGPRHDLRVETPGGTALAPIPLSDIPETVATDGDGALAAPPRAVTGRFADGETSRAFGIDLPAGDWRVTAVGTSPTRPLDPWLAILAADGREIATSDDAAGTLDPAATLTVAEAAPYSIVVGARELSSAPLGPAVWRLVIERQRPSFEPSAALATQVAVPLGGSAKLPLSIVRTGGFAGPVAVAFRGLPDGVTAPTDAAIGAGSSDAAVDLSSAADSGSAAGLATIVLSGTLDSGAAIVHERPLLVAPTMKPRVKIVPDGLDDVRKVHRGTTFRGPLTITRLEGFEGPVRIEPTAKQQRHRQGMDGGEIVVPAGVARCDYPVFVPEWMETTRTSRFIVNGAVEVNDPRGRPRTLLERQELRLGMLPVGAIMKLQAPAEVIARPGTVAEVPVGLVRAAEFRTLPLDGPVVVGLSAVAPADGGAAVGMAGIQSPGLHLARHDLETEEGMVRLAIPADAERARAWRVTLRATALEAGRYPIVSEATVTLVVE